MRPLGVILAVIGLALHSPAQQPTNITFNLVQVNHYHGQPQATDSVRTPGQRIVIDLGNPAAIGQFLPGSPAHVSLAPVRVSVEPMASVNNGGVRLPWESSTVLRSSSGTDSFLVATSQTGCPGTEVAPSVSVAFAMNGRWSDPPIRFGPLAERTTCPLGRGCLLEVSVAGDGVPVVCLREEGVLYGKR